MKKNSQEGISAPVPVKKSDFKPRVDKYACQYCEYKGSSRNVDVHVKSQHEMQEWFKCMICKHVSLRNDHMILHLGRHHKSKVDREEINKLIIKDPNEILKHKKAMIKKRNLKTIGKKTKFIPIDKDNFKQRKDSKICQYCDYRNNKCKVDEHVNGCHEMNQWYQCGHCPYATLFKDILKVHVLRVHDQKLTNQIFHELIIKDQEKIDQLKREKIRKKKRQR